MGWCTENNLALNIKKTKNDFRRKQDVHTPLYINEEMVERVSSFKFLDKHISEELTWTINITALVKKAKWLYFLRMLRKVNLSQQLLLSFYRCSIESVLTHGMLACYGSSSAADKKALPRVIKTAQNITKQQLPAWTTFLPPTVCRKYTIF